MIKELISGLIQPVTTLVDDLHTSDEERLTLQRQLFEVEQQLACHLMDYEARLVEAKQQVVMSEAKGDSTLQRVWRPVTMLTFLGLVVADSFGLTKLQLSPEIWVLFKIGLGGYIVGRSAEKIAPTLSKTMEAMKRNG